jgi:hypothetical protein
MALGTSSFTRTALHHLTAAALFATASSAQAQLIANGSFELDPPHAQSWQSSGDVEVSSVLSGLATDGQYLGVLGFGNTGNSAQSGTVYQDFALTEAGKFAYSFDAGSVFFGFLTFPVTFQFRIDDTVITDAVPLIFSDGLPGGFRTLQTRIAGDIDLEAGTHRFAFDISRDATLFVRGASFAIDDIHTSFTPSVAGAVPEPSAWALLILGFGAVGAGLRRPRTTARLA